MCPVCNPSDAIDDVTVASGWDDDGPQEPQQNLEHKFCGTIMELVCLVNSISASSPERCTSQQPGRPLSPRVFDRSWSTLCAEL